MTKIAKDEDWRLEDFKVPLKLQDLQGFYCLFYGLTFFSFVIVGALYLVIVGK
jgi:hypothetical protein